jgi:hypothetical protein
MKARVKFRVISVVVKEAGIEIRLESIVDPADKWNFWQATTKGNMQMTITNPAISNQILPEQEFLVDFSPA